jgi:hypothetical protein
MLECGHMCTCTNCGKQMAECPICRQYVVRYTVPLTICAQRGLGVIVTTVNE